MIDMKSFDEAKEIIESYFLKIKTSVELVALDESCGRILAEDIYSDLNLPPFNNSAMDGFAVKFNSEIREWEIIDEIAAGKFHDIELSDNQTTGIMTGGKLPEGADTVLPIENCIINGNILKVNDDYSIKKGMNTRLLGEDLHSGMLALIQGTLINSKHIHLAAACGKRYLTVFKKLKVGILASGDELVSIDTTPVKDQIRSSNLEALKASVSSLNMIAVDFGIVKDNRQLIKEILLNALNSDIDLLLTSGGVSVGKYDFIQEVLREIGSEIIFWKVNIKPGKPLLFSVFSKENKYIPVISLPGNPVSSYLNFRLFAEHAILNLFGIRLKNSFKAKLTNPIKKKDSKRHFILATSEFNNELNCFEAESAGIQSSGALTSLSKADCLIVFPEDKYSIEKGEWAECIRI
jgi:molybdopterin molybdotransferase